MDNVAQVVELFEEQAALKDQLMEMQPLEVAAGWALANTGRRLVAYRQALAAVLHTARALRRSPDTVSVPNVTNFDWIN